MFFCVFQWIEKISRCTIGMDPFPLSYRLPYGRRRDPSKLKWHQNFKDVENPECFYIFGMYYRNIPHRTKNTNNIFVAHSEGIYSSPWFRKFYALMVVLKTCSYFCQQILSHHAMNQFISFILQVNKSLSSYIWNFEMPHTSGSKIFFCLLGRHIIKSLPNIYFHTLIYKLQLSTFVFSLLSIFRNNIDHMYPADVNKDNN